LDAPLPLLLLRDGLLAGLPVVLAGPAEPGELGGAAGDACRGAGADVVALTVDPSTESEPPSPVEAGAAAAPVVVWDGDGAFAAAGIDPSVASVRAALDGAWLAVRPTAVAAMIPDARGGKVVLIAPRAGGPHHEAARAGLENLARTLGTEWARYGIRTVAILPAAGSAAGEVGQLVAYLASPAGDYFTGCALTLGAAG
jgi:hypothetical protein